MNERDSSSSLDTTQLRVKVHSPIEQQIIHPSAPPPRAASYKVAVIVCHGMGQQVPFETLDCIAKALLEREKKHNPAKYASHNQPGAEVRFVKLQEETFPRAELLLTDSSGNIQEVHLYEGYWAPLTEGKISALDVLKFLLNAGLKGIIYSVQGYFKRYMFGRQERFNLAWWKTIPELFGAFLIVCALVVIYLTFLIVGTARILMGFEIRLPNYALIDVLTGDIILYFLIVGGLFIVGYAVSKIISPIRFLRSIFMWAVVVSLLITTLIMGSLVVWHWGHLWQNNFLNSLDSSFVNLANFDLGCTEWPIHLCWTKPVYVVFLLLAAFACYQGRWFFIQYFGDVAAYVSAHTVNKFYELRQQIQQVGLSVASAVYGAQDNTGQYEYANLIMVGHSLGSVVAYDTLNAIINRDLLQARRMNAVRRTKLLITFGSPLDKTAFIFRTQAKDAVIREALAAARQPMIRKYAYRPRYWINIWSRNDWISGSLEYYDKPGKSKLQTTKRIINIIDKAADRPILAHTQYWENKTLAELLYAASTGRDLDQSMQQFLT